MEKKYTNFQIILMVTFGFLALVGFVFFATYRPNDAEPKVEGKVVIWGTLSADLMDSLISELREDEDLENVTYVEKSLNTYEHDLLEAIAAGISPDLFLVSQRDIFSNLNKIYTIPHVSYPLRDFNDNFADAFSIFTNSKGVVAIPFLIDPMVMYYNKNIFATHAISVPPTDWEEFYLLAEDISELDSEGNIRKSAVAFGETVNATHFKDFLTTMILQTGDPLVYEDEDGYRTTAGEQKTELSQILTYYTSFSNPNSEAYSWNRSLPESVDFFVSGSLATYFGFVSELRNLRLKNPNLNFDVAEIPTYRGADEKTVFARVWGMAIPKAAANKGGAFQVANILAGEAAQAYLSEEMKLPPVRRSMLAQRHLDPYMDIFYREAIYARSWIDPDYQLTEEIFANMINSVLSNQNTPRTALSEALQEIDLLLEEDRI